MGRPYREFGSLTIGELELLSQAYTRLVGEGYAPGFDFKDFLDIVMAQGDYTDTKCDEIMMENNR